MRLFIISIFSLFFAVLTKAPLIGKVPAAKLSHIRISGQDGVIDKSFIAATHLGMQRPDILQTGSPPEDYNIFWDWQFGLPGVAGSIYDIAVDKEIIYIAGKFNAVDGNILSNVAMWDGSFWVPLGDGLQGTVYSLELQDGRLVAAGEFLYSGDKRMNNIAWYDSTGWNTLGSGLDGTVLDISVRGKTIYAGGNFLKSGTDTVRYAALWDGSEWHQMGGGFDAPVRSIDASFSDVYAAGEFLFSDSTRLNYAAVFRNDKWEPLGEGLNHFANTVEITQKGVFFRRVFYRSRIHRSPLCCILFCRQMAIFT